MLSQDAAVGQAASLMVGFAERTGLTSERAPPRYLWTDAFAVCNFLGLARVTGEARFQLWARELAAVAHARWTTDALGLGGLLTDAWRLAQLRARGVPAEQGLLDGLLEAAEEGLALYAPERALRQPADRRLAFRELGLAIGLAAVERLQRDTGLRARLERLAPHAALGRAIASFWLEPAHQQADTWTQHRDINEVMLATRLVPGGFLGPPA